jgi:hypothetical protein
MTSKEQSQYSRYCIGSNNPCASLKLATQKAIERAKEKMGNMLNDKTLYDNAYSTPNPGVTGTSTTWIGHVDDLNGRLGTIAALISLGQKMGCDMSAEILEAASLFVPLKPAGR